MNWDTSSLAAMEATAKGEADGVCAKKIRDNWLEVRFDHGNKSFRYQWGKNEVARSDALEVHE